MLGQLVEFAVGAGLEATRLGMLKDQCVGPVVEIAQAQGWVSVGRLRTRMGLSLRDARFVLSVACQRGLLYEAPNGRFYIKQKPVPAFAVESNAPIFAPLPDEPAPTPNAVRSVRKVHWPVIVTCWVAVAAGGVTWGVAALDRPAAHGSAYRPASIPDASPLPPSAPSPPEAEPAASDWATVDRRQKELSAKLNAAPPSTAPVTHGSKKHARQHRHATSTH